MVIRKEKGLYGIKCIKPFVQNLDGVFVSGPHHCPALSERRGEQHEVQIQTCSR